MAEATGQVDAPEVVDGAKCPFARVNKLEDVSRLLRSKTAVTHSPDLNGLRVVVGNDGSGGAHVMLLKKLMDAGVRPDPDNPPVGLKKDMDKFDVEDIPRYIKYPAIFDGGPR
jgi:hypothetical protein